MTNKRPVPSPVSHLSPAPALSPVSQCHILVSTRDTDQMLDLSSIFFLLNMSKEGKNDNSDSAPNVRRKVN